MKTVKRKAEVGERVKTDGGEIMKVGKVTRDGVYKSGATVGIIHGHYEVIIEDEPKIIKSDSHGTLVKSEDGKGYQNAIDVEELKDEAMKRLLTPNKAREKLNLPPRVHPKPTTEKRDDLDYGGPMGTPIPPHSTHYHQNGLDPLEVMRRTFPPEQYEGFLRGNALKYIMRYPIKGTPVEDLEKAKHYIDKLLGLPEETRTKVTLEDAQGNIIDETYEEGAE